MSKDLAVLEFRRTRNSYKIFFKSSFCEDVFKKLARVDSAGNPIVESVSDSDGAGSLYQMYSLARGGLPTVPFNLNGSWDVLNNYGWMRAQGVASGILVPSLVPIVGNIAPKLASRVEQNLLALTEAQGISDKTTDVTRYKFIKED